MTHTVVLAPLGPNMEEAEVQEWLVGIGQLIEQGEPILAVETEKTTIEVSSTAAGTLTKQLVQLGAMVRVGDPIAELES